MRRHGTCDDASAQMARQGLQLAPQSPAHTGGMHDRHRSPAELAAWFAARGWRVRRISWRCLRLTAAGQHALAGGRYRGGQDAGAGFCRRWPISRPSGWRRAPPPDGLHTLYVSPLKALAHDVQRNLLAPVDELGLPLTDRDPQRRYAHRERKARQRARPPHVLLTTPESLSLLLSYPEAATLFAGLQRVVIDEVHAFATGKRGDLLALALARLQALAPGLQPRGAVGNAGRSGRLSRLAGAAGRDRMRSTLVEGEPGAPPELSNPAARGCAGAMGRARGGLGGAAAVRGDPGQPDHAGFHQHAVSGRIHLSAAVERQRRQPADRDPPRLALQGGAAQGRRGDGARGTARAGRDRQPRSGGRLGRYRSGGADGRAQGLVAAAPADRPGQPPARSAQPRAAGSRQPV